MRAELCALLQRSVRDPAVRLVTLTHVRMSRDLQHARVYYTTLGDTPTRRETARGLRRAAPFPCAAGWGTGSASDTYRS